MLLEYDYLPDLPAGRRIDRLADLEGIDAKRQQFLEQERTVQRNAARRVASERCPCSGCPHRIRCAAEKLACQAFQEYAAAPDMLKSARKPWTTMKRGRPSRAVYVEIFAE